MITLLFISLAAMFNAICDTLKDHYETSVFSKLPELFWNPNVSYKVKLWRWVSIDAWHISKALWIGCLLLYGYFFEGGFAELIIAWVLWTIVFETFYSKLLIKPKQ